MLLLLGKLFPGENLAVHREIMVGQALVVVFNLAALAVIGIGAQIVHRRIEILLEGTVGDHAEGIEVAEVEIPAIESAEPPKEQSAYSQP